MKRFYVYIGTSKSQEPYMKIGQSGYIRGRMVTMNTSYAMDGCEISMVIECESSEEIQDIENFLHGCFLEASTMLMEGHTGGTEWFNRQFVSEDIRKALESGKYTNQVIDDPEQIQEINNMIQKNVSEINQEILCQRKILCAKIKEKERLRMKISCKLRPYQTDALEKSREYYKTHDKGILNWACGLGKTIEALSISKDYFKTSMVIGVNFVNLIPQWLDELKRFYPGTPVLVVASKYPEDKLYTCLTEETDILNWIIQNDKHIIITTYQSSHKLEGMSDALDFKIYDECHHLCSSDSNSGEGRRNTDIFKIHSTKSLGLTATVKQLDTDDSHIDNLSEEYFGKIIDSKGIMWAITNGHLSEFRMMTPKIELAVLEEMLERNGLSNISSEDYYMYLSAYMAVNSHQKYSDIRKTLIFCNTKVNVHKVIQYLDIHIENLKHSLEDDEITRIPFIKGLTDDNNVKESNEIIREFGSCQRGILVNIMKIGEGIDIPSLDSVLFADEMSSSIRIIQSALRPCRKDPNNETKVATIIIPMIYEAEDDQSYSEEDGGLRIRGYRALKKIIGEISDSDDMPILEMKSSSVEKADTRAGGLGTRFILQDDIDFDHTLQMRIYSRELLGKHTFPYMAKIVQKHGGRKDSSMSLEDDYQRNTSKIYGLPDYEFIRDYIDRDRNGSRSWLELYGIKTDNFYGWPECRDKTDKMTPSQYKEVQETDDKYPNYHDLELVYGDYGYVRDFFDKNVDGDVHDEDF